MTPDNANSGPVEALLATPDLARALESEPFRHFLDQIPIAIVVSRIGGTERIIYANPEFERLSGQFATALIGEPWSFLHGQGHGEDVGRKLGVAVLDSNDRVGTFQIERTGCEPAVVDAYSNIIEEDDGTPAFRFAALVEVGTHGLTQREELKQHVQERETLLLEVLHRVKNNLQMITALIRLEMRNLKGSTEGAPFDRLVGRIDAIGLVYKLLSGEGQGDDVDLGVYLSEIASSLMHSYATEGIRLDLKVDAYPISVNVAMPTGLVVNEVLTNAFKHAFVGRPGGTITLHSLVDEAGCRIVVADDGIGLPEGVEWPQSGKLGSLIVRSLRENAKAKIKVESEPGNGTRVIILLARP